MNYGKTAAPNAGTNSVSYAIEGATAVYAHVQSIGMATRIGVTPMIGQNDIPGEFFRTTDGTQLVTWAKSRAWVGFISYWSANRDTNVVSTNLDVSSGITQAKWAFARVFVQYEN
jgi:chitinase